MDLQRKQMVSSLCKHFSLDHTKLSSDVLKSDLRALYLNLVKSSGTERENNDAVMKWVDFVENFTAESKACLRALNKLNENLASISVLLGDGLTPSGADVMVYSTVHSSVIGLPNSDKTKLRHVIRWMDYVQMKENLIELFERIPIERPEFVPQGANNAAKLAVDSNTKKTVQDAKSTEKSETDPSVKKSDAGKKSTLDKEAPKEKKKSPDAAVDKEKEVSVSLLKIQVGLIRKCWKHPSADSLLVEEIDVADAKLRQVVSGLAKYCNPDELMNRCVVLITNVKPGKLRDVMSEGLVLCASNEDHTIVEPLLAPEGAKLGECILFPGIDGKPEDVLNPKKKQLEKITPHLFTDDKGVATFKGIPFMTSAGPCTSSIPKASIK